jgi:hypothetical protein
MTEEQYTVRMPWLVTAIVKANLHSVAKLSMGPDGAFQYSARAPNCTPCMLPPLRCSGATIWNMMTASAPGITSQTRCVTVKHSWGR